jgi:hypothetical protein
MIEPSSRDAESSSMIARHFEKASRRLLRQLSASIGRGLLKIALTRRPPEATGMFACLPAILSIVGIVGAQGS